MRSSEMVDARKLFEKWFSENQGVQNPTDINRPIKWEWFFDMGKKKGFEAILLMEKAKKNKLDFTESRYWKPA